MHYRSDRQGGYSAYISQKKRIFFHQLSENVPALPYNK